MAPTKTTRITSSDDHFLFHCCSPFLIFGFSWGFYASFPLFLVLPALFPLFLDHRFHFLLLLGGQDGVDLLFQLRPGSPRHACSKSVRNSLIRSSFFLKISLILSCCSAVKPRSFAQRSWTDNGRSGRPPVIRLFRQPPALGEDSADDARGENQDEGHDDPKLGFFHGAYLRLGMRSFPAKMIIMFLFSIFSSLNRVLVSARGIDVPQEQKRFGLAHLLVECRAEEGDRPDEKSDEHQGDRDGPEAPFQPDASRARLVLAPRIRESEALPEIGEGLGLGRTLQAAEHAL